MFGLPPPRHDRNRTTVYPPKLRWIFYGVSAIGVVLLLASMGWLLKHQGELSNRYSILIGGFWIAVPPLFFLLEFFYLYPRWGYPDRLEYFKIGQELASKCWAASLVILYVCANGKLPGA